MLERSGQVEPFPCWKLQPGERQGKTSMLKSQSGRGGISYLLFPPLLLFSSPSLCLCWGSLGPLRQQDAKSWWLLLLTSVNSMGTAPVCFCVLVRCPVSTYIQLRRGMALYLTSFYFFLCVVLVTRLYKTLCDPMDCSLPGSSVHGILHSSILEWGAIPFSRGSSQPRDQTQISCIASRFFTIWATREAPFFPLAPSS